MNIAIVNKYYFVSGGPERYLFSVKELLESRGHKVVPLALRLSRNEPSEYAKCFLPPPAGQDAPRYEGFDLTAWKRAKLLGRALYWPLARRRVAEVARREGIDAVYLLNIANYISPSVIDGARDAGARVVMRLSDYNFACVSYHLFRDGGLCEDCLGGTPLLGAARRCLHGSLALSSARALTMMAHRLLGVYRRVDAFVAPSRFMARALLQWGAPRDKVHWLPSFVDLDAYAPKFEAGGYALYFGRLSAEKGVDVLLRAWASLGAESPPLKIVGWGDEEPALRRLADSLGLRRVAFCGFQERAEIVETVRNAAFVVVPSIWPDNAPMAVYEGMALGKAVVASRIGGLEDQVAHGRTGLLVPPGDADALARAARALWRDPDRAESFGRAARRRMEEQFSPMSHVERLERILSGEL